MKKLFAMFLCAALCGAAVFGFAACGPHTPAPVTGKFTVVAPDGAPALALANLLHREEVSPASVAPDADITFETTIVQASGIQSHVTFEEEESNADFCILPVNVAAKLLGTGERYQMLGTVTNGNMFFLTAEGENITAETLASLVGKKVGVVQLNNVPGLTLQSVLKKKNISYGILSSVNDAPDAEKVNLVPFADAKTVGPAAGCDYYLCPEPAASAKTKNGAMTIVGSLQTVYGGGYPQAVAVAKCSVITGSPAAVEKFIQALEGSEAYLNEATPAEVLAALAPAYQTGFDPTFSAGNLTAEVIAHCSVRFTAAKDCKTEVNAFLSELIGVNAQFTTAVSDAFYYQGN